MKLVLALLALAGVAFAEPVDNRITGGNGALIEDYPFMASVQLLHDELWWYHVTGGTLLTRVLVLTTARYLWNGPPADWRVRLGARTASSGGSLHPVSEMVLHPEYHSNFYNDLAIIRLAIPAVYSNTVQRASIAGPNYILPEGTPVHAAGWGSGMLARPASEVLRRVDMNIINHDFCTAQYAALSSWPNVTERMICAGIDGRSTCDNDVGGPVLHNRNVVVGVIGFSYGCGHPDYPAVHARVSHYASWIGSFS